MSGGDTKSEIAASRAIYFRDLEQGSSGSNSEGNSTPESRAKRPSYVGISTSLNGYTPYASYRTDTGRRISPPLHLPNQRQQPQLDSVALVLNQDGFQRSLAEFQETMRDITMGRPESSDMTDNARILNVHQDQFFPTSHMKEVIKDGEGKSVTTITQFHSSNGGANNSTPPTSGSGPTTQQQKKNLVSKQIERLYGGDPFAQIRLTSPEHHFRGGEQPVDEFYRSPTADSSAALNGGSHHDEISAAERKISSGGGGGFFAKRFGITKMKDHSTLKSPSSADQVPGEIKPLKVPAVFKLLRPEFREQLKQSSCKVSMPDEDGSGGKERIIPIQREVKSAPAHAAGGPLSPHAPSRQVADPAATPTSRPIGERIIPITRINNGGSAADSQRLSNGGSGGKQVNGSSTSSALVNGNSSNSVNGGGSMLYNGGRHSSMTSSPLINGNGANNSPSPLVNGSSVVRRSVPTVIGFRQSPNNDNKNTTAGGVNNNNSDASSVITVPAKPLIIRKLSPLSPKHIFVPSSNNDNNSTNALKTAATKPAPAPKPEHLMSPPLSPVPSTDSGRSTTGSSTAASSPCPPLVPQDTVNDTPVASQDITVEQKQHEQLPEIEKLALRDQAPEVEDAEQQEKTNLMMNGDCTANNSNDIVEEEQNYQMDADYLEYNGGEEELERDQYTPQYYGLRERELLHPILEEDNESTASGSLLNLQQASSGGSLHSLQHAANNAPAAGATVNGSSAASRNTVAPAANGSSDAGASNSATAGSSSASGCYASDDPLLLTEQGEIQDGHYFIKVLENEIFKFEEQICDFEEELGMSEDIPEECREKILSTVGLAKLLMAQKLTQFRGLCDKNINVSKEEDPFVPTSEDLAGFWDMVHIQVEQVHNRFAELQKLRSQGWKEKKVEAKPKAKKPMNKNVNKPIKPKEKSEAAKARDEARKKMLEAKKKAMKENKENKENSDLIIIM